MAELWGSEVLSQLLDDGGGQLMNSFAESSGGAQCVDDLWLESDRRWKTRGLILANL